MPSASDSVPRKRVRWHVVLGALASIFALLYIASWVGTGYMYIRIYTDQPALYLIPQPLPDAALAKPSQQHSVGALGYAWNMPCEAPILQSSRSFMRADCPNAFFVILLENLANQDLTKPMRDIVRDNRRALPKVDETIYNSRRSWLFESARTTPASLSLFHRRRNLVPGFLLTTKMASIRSDAKAIYWFNEGQWQGLQVGDTAGKSVQLYLFDNADREVELLLGRAKGTPSSSFTQADINAFVASLSER